MKHYYEDGGLGGRGRVPDIELAERDRLAVLVQTMNKRGV